LIGILEYLLVEAGARIALRYEAEFRIAFRSLASNPGLGHLRQELTERSFLFYSVKPYLVVYEKNPDYLLVHAILHGSQNAGPVLQGRKS
jgi:plasmid stabilization system protein ParE